VAEKSESQSQNVKQRMKAISLWDEMTKAIHPKSLEITQWKYVSLAQKPE
jgi:hypothetical protein